MPAAALSLYLIYLLVAFGARTLLHYRQTGSTGFVGVARDSGPAARIGVALFALALIAGMVAPVLDLIGVLPAIAGLDQWPVHVLGIALYVTGFVGTALAQGQMGSSWRIGVHPAERTHLVTKGLFRFVRNPIFSAMILVGVGLALVDPTLLALAAVACLVLGIQIQVRLVEEPHLMRLHGAEYARYAAHVGRFVPGVGCHVPGSTADIAPR